jgi:glucosylceramidase
MTFHKNGFQDKKIIVWDHNRDLIYQRASTILNDPEAAKYVWGVSSIGTKHGMKPKSV